VVNCLFTNFLVLLTMGLDKRNRKRDLASISIPPRRKAPNRMNPGTRRTSRWNKTAEKEPEIAPESQKWTSADEAIALIQKALDVGAETGRSKLIEACASKKVRSYYIAALLTEPLIRLAPITPHLWAVEGGATDLKSGRFRSSDCYEGAIFINGVDL